MKWSHFYLRGKTALADNLTYTDGYSLIEFA